MSFKRGQLQFKSLDYTPACILYVAHCAICFSHASVRELLESQCRKGEEARIPYSLPVEDDAFHMALSCDHIRGTYRL